MPIEVVLPKVDMDMASGVIAAWKVAEGSFVKEGDVLFEMETDKSVMEVESPGTGTIRGLVGITGEPIAVGAPVAWIDVGGTIATIATAATVGAVAAVAARSPDSDRSAGEIRGTPSARRTARLRNVDLAAVTGTGPRGRIVAKDVDAYADARERASPEGKARIETAATDVARADANEQATATTGTDATADAAGGELVPFSPIRRIVAQRLADSVHNAPHFYLTAQVEMTALRDAIRWLGPGILKTTGVKLSVTVLFARIVGRVLAQHPLINASLEGAASRLHRHVHVGIAMDRNGDLVVPVLRNVDTGTLAELVKDFGRLSDAVRARTIAAADMRGGTFTISNLGMYEVDAFTAIINQPESAILAIGRTVDTPVGRDGQIVLRPMATLALSSDHRIVDGITAARFMADLRRAIEDPAAML